MFLLFCDALDRQSLICRTLVFGVGIEAPSRYSASMPSVKSSLMRRSGVRNADANALSTKFLLRRCCLGTECRAHQVTRTVTGRLGHRSAQANSRTARAHTMRPRTGPGGGEQMV